MGNESPGGHRQKGRHATHHKQTSAPRLGTPPGRNQQATGTPPAPESTRGAVKHHDRTAAKVLAKIEDDKPPTRRGS